jgi:hypothetical protein
MDLAGNLVVLAFISGAVMVPLLLRNRRDRREAEALQLQAHLQSVANRRLGGETFLVVTVHPGLAGARGRVVLTAPPSWQWLIPDVWNAVRHAMPQEYELVVSGAGAGEARDRGWLGIRESAARTA